MLSTVFLCCLYPLMLATFSFYSIPKPIAESLPNLIDEIDNLDFEKVVSIWCVVCVL